MSATLSLVLPVILVAFSAVGPRVANGAHGSLPAATLVAVAPSKPSPVIFVQQPGKPAPSPQPLPPSGPVVVMVPPNTRDAKPSPVIFASVPASAVVQAQAVPTPPPTVMSIVPTGPQPGRTALVGVGVPIALGEPTILYNPVTAALKVVVPGMLAPVALAVQVTAVPKVLLVMAVPKVLLVMARAGPVFNKAIPLLLAHQVVLAVMVLLDILQALVVMSLLQAVMVVLQEVLAAMVAPQEVLVAMAVLLMAAALAFLAMPLLVTVVPHMLLIKDLSRIRL
ncbi:unnamed protein product (mitochondrion) [Plasmodiophora brassicae]|uniref:Uncharacterized protein n=1 Tax=Plasmodiophora brassicae TaxID=37360 RepID=A0A3P3YDI3_PLABS|nr:unnamed protein product [Plasmodiophora brassicae]